MHPTSVPWKCLYVLVLLRSLHSIKCNSKVLTYQTKYLLKVWNEEYQRIHMRLILNQYISGLQVFSMWLNTYFILSYNFCRTIVPLVGGKSTFFNYAFIWWKENETAIYTHAYLKWLHNLRPHWCRNVCEVSFTTTISNDILYKASSNNYVDQILPNFDHLPPCLCVQLWIS